MATKTQTPTTPLSRFSRLGLSLGFRSSTAPHLSSQQRPNSSPDEDWYIPYNGPYEQPQSLSRSPTDDRRDVNSWGPVVNGWIMEEPGEISEQGLGAEARRVYPSNPRALTTSVSEGENRRDDGLFRRSRFFKSDPAGGVGEMPVPVRVRTRRSQESGLRAEGSGNRLSLASIFPFTQPKRGNSVRKVTSSDHLRARENQISFPRGHPYAYATPAVSQQGGLAQHEPPARARSRSSVNLSIKASVSTPNLRLRLPPPAPPRTQNQQTHAVSALVPGPSTAPPTPSYSLPKMKQRWLSAETWCDALIAPRPRFAIKVVDGEGNASSGRIVSPPGSPVWPSSSASVPAYGAFVTSEGEGAQRGELKGALKKSRSAGDVYNNPPGVAGPSNEREVQRPVAAKEMPRAVGGLMAGARAADTAPSTKPPRPKSFAWDDLALLSPVPSLAKVLEDGRQLDAERKQWQAQATRSFQNSRARTISRTRTRAKSLGSRHPSVPDLRSHSHTHLPPLPLSQSRNHSRTDVAGCLDVLAERSILGNQMRPPTVHVRLMSSDLDIGTTASHGRAHSHSRTASGSVVGSRTRARSHAHSNSLGTSASNGRSDDSSFMWDPAPTHGRSHSIGKSALKIVRSTAATAATLCGFSPVERDKASEMSEPAVPPGIDTTSRNDTGRSPRLQMQTSMLGHERRNEGEGVMVITPQSPSAALAFALRNRSGMSALHPVISARSPTPSGLTPPADGMVGIALSSPPSSAEDHTWQQRNVADQIRIPPHPYAQGTNTYVYQPPPSGSDASRGFKESPQGHSARGSRDDSLNRSRQPVLVHPYSPFTHTPHPYAAQSSSPRATAGEAAGSSPAQWVEVPPDASMFAELTPGHVREFHTEDIRYSPVDPPADASPRYLERPVGHAVGHPYGPSANRLSEWGFADALTHTLRRQGSTDSGLGTSEDHAVAQDANGRPPAVRIIQEDELGQNPVEEVPGAFFGSGRLVPGGPRPYPNNVPMQTPSNTLRSSTSLDRPPLWHSTSNKLSNTSSGSSPGMISHESSPPLSPRAINTAEDLERFRGLFYEPPDRTDASSEDFSGSLLSRRRSGSFPLDITSQSTRTVSGLTTLARQLTEDLEELRESAMREGGRDSGDSEREPSGSPMWGRRYGGLRGQRPDDFVLDPNVVLMSTPSDSDSPPDITTSPLRLPLDRSLALSQPTINVPEDVEMSPRTSSELDMPVPEDTLLRLGTISALNTPPASASPQRFSRHLSFIGGQDINSAHPSDDFQSQRHYSQHSSLAPPLSSDAARSSFMTVGTNNTSRMSGLSDFPAPPTDFATPGHASIINSYFNDTPDHHSLDPLDAAARPALVREPSRGTFGKHQDVGEAF